MKKSILVIALMSAFVATSAFADVDVYANSVTSTYASAGNGGTSHSTASNFAVGSGYTDSSVHLGFLSVTVPDCNVPTTATVFGTVTTVSGTASTMGGSYASNTSTGNGVGEAHAWGIAASDVSKSRNGVSGEASSITATWANADTDQTRSSFASQDASFNAAGATGLLTVTTEQTIYVPGTHHHPGHYITVPHVEFVGVGAISTGNADVPASHQVYSLTTGGCNHGCQNGVGNDNAGSYTNGQASTYTNVSIGNSPF